MGAALAAYRVRGTPDGALAAECARCADSPEVVITEGGEYDFGRTVAELETLAIRHGIIVHGDPELRDQP